MKAPPASPATNPAEEQKHRKSDIHALVGLTLVQDLSGPVPRLTGWPPGFSLGKSHPSFGPTGPVVAAPDELRDGDGMGVELTIDDEVIQHRRTSLMICSVDGPVARISAVCPLLPGDPSSRERLTEWGNRRTLHRLLQSPETFVGRLEGGGEIRQTFVA